MQWCNFCGEMIAEKICSFADSPWHKDLVHACNEFQAMRQETDYQVGQLQMIVRSIEFAIIRLRLVDGESDALAKKMEELNSLCRKIEKIVNDGGKQIVYWSDQVHACLQQKPHTKRRAS